MKPTRILPFLFLPVFAQLSAAETPSGTGQTHGSSRFEEQSPAAILAAQIREIASSQNMSVKSQAKLLTNAVKVAVSAVIEGIKDPSERLKRALELTTAAAKAAPQFGATITSAVASIPAIGGQEGALGMIQAAVKAGIAAGDDAAGSKDRDDDAHRSHGKHEFEGPDKDETVVSPSH